ncbi:MAG TPA: helical backbone metal receptor [bacterium]|nr:helical backbone metal receptor [bacterium]HPP30659.1 helical backbone metal receptor [bacterium]
MKKILCFLVLFLFTSLPAVAEPLKIVSLGPYITENLCLLGLEKNIVGLTIYDREEIKKGKEIIGTLLEPNIEKIVSLKPDIVIGSKEGNRQEHIEKLKKLGIKTLVLDQLFTFEDICKNFITLGETLNCKDRAEEIIKEVNKRLKNIENITAKEKKKKKIFFILGFKPLFTTGKNTYINKAIQYAGGVNIFGDINKKWFSVSVEDVIKKNPEIIIFLTMEEEQILLWERLKDTDAVKNKKIFSIEPTVIGSPTPQSFVQTVENLYKMFYLKGNEN